MLIGIPATPGGRLLHGCCQLRAFPICPMRHLLGRRADFGGLGGLSVLCWTGIPWPSGRGAGAFFFGLELGFLSVDLDDLGETFLVDLSIPERLNQTDNPADENASALTRAGIKAAQYRKGVFDGQGLLSTDSFAHLAESSGARKRACKTSSRRRISRRSRSRQQSCAIVIAWSGGRSSSSPET